MHETLIITANEPKPKNVQKLMSNKTEMHQPHENRPHVCPSDPTTTRLPGICLPMTRIVSFVVRRLVEGSPAGDCAQVSFSKRIIWPGRRVGGN